MIKATRETQTKENLVGECMICKKGKLMVRRGKFGKFIACDKYPKCKTTFALPHNALTKASKNICNECKYPSVTIIKKGKRPQELCINPDCKSKTHPTKETEKEKTCPKCKNKLILRKSFYGEFYGCSNYPKCRHTEKIIK